MELLVRFLSDHEDNGEVVNQIYEILGGLVSVSKAVPQAQQNVSVVDMHKSLLHVAIKHSSVYQCETAFFFLKSLVEISDKYQNKADIQLSLTKIMPASVRGAEAQ